MSTAYEDAIAEAEYWALRASDALAADDPLEHAEASDKAREARRYAETLKTPARRKKAAKVPTEATEQARLVEAFRSRGWLVMATANGVPMSDRARTQFSRSGGSRGTPDLFVFEAVGGFVGIAIEMKRARGSKTSPEQKRWMGWLTARGWLAIVAKGADDGLRQIDEALKEVEG